MASQELEDKRDAKNAVIKAMQDAITKRQADCQVLQDKLAKLHNLEQVLPFVGELVLLAELEQGAKTCMQAVRAA